MEESLKLDELLQYYRESMDMEKVDPAVYSPLVLAYIGDGVYEVMIRAKVINRGSMQVNKMHKHSAMLVKASAQAALIQAIEPDLTAQEHAVYKRGRNAKSATVAKNASVIDYRKATGFEALVGWLFLNGQYKRLTDLVSVGLKRTGLMPQPEGNFRKDEGDTTNHEI